MKTPREFVCCESCGAFGQRGKHSADKCNGTYRRFFWLFEKIARKRTRKYKGNKKCS